MKFSRKTILPALIVPATALALAGCQPSNGATVTNCSQGRCVTTQVTLNTSPPATLSPPVQSEQPTASIPGVSDTTTTPSPGVTDTPAVSQTQAIQACFPQGAPSKDTLVSFASDQGNLGCLAIPPQTMRYFIRELLAYIFAAPPQTWRDQGDYDNWQQQQVVPLVQRCQQGQSS